MESAKSSNHPYSATDLDFKYIALKEITIVKITLYASYQLKVPIKSKISCQYFFLLGASLIIAYSITVFPLLYNSRDTLAPHVSSSSAISSKSHPMLHNPFKTIVVLLYYQPGNPCPPG